MSDWRTEEQQVKTAIQGLSTAETGDRALDAQKIFELANRAYLLYVSQNSVEKAKLLKCMVRRPTAGEKFWMKKVCVNVSGLCVEVLFSWP